MGRVGRRWSSSLYPYPSGLYIGRVLTYLRWSLWITSHFSPVPAVPSALTHLTGSANPDHMRPSGTLSSLTYSYHTHEQLVRSTIRYR